MTDADDARDTAPKPSANDAPANDAPANDDVRDSLPDDLHVDHASEYEFPDNSRRRKPGYLYLGFAAACLLIWLTKRDSSALVNNGFLWAAILLSVVALFSITSGWRMQLDEQQALVKAQGAVGFPVGHASAQQVWRGLRSRPTWRVLIYSAEDPPRRRGLVLVDAVDGGVVEHMVQDNPVEDWDV
ncbi:MAG: hypothetical protein Q7V88_17960 [Actinomycetota bacterium]|nr:hypothetical protein [Actinomycetota bacterium]